MFEASPVHKEIVGNSRQQVANRNRGTERRFIVPNPGEDAGCAWFETSLRNSQQPHRRLARFPSS